MTTFDTIIKVMKPYRQFHPILDGAARFHFDRPPHEFLPKEIPEEQADWLKEYFFLPFQHTAIEDPAGTVILIDPEPDTVGFDVTRKFIDCIHADTDTKNFREGQTSQQDLALENLKKEMSGLAVLTFGIIKMEWNTTTQYQVRGDVTNIIIADIHTGEVKESFDSKRIEEIGGMAAINSGLLNASTAMQEIMELNRPDRFILKTVHPRAVAAYEKMRSKGKKITIASATERPEYTLLTPKEIREKTGMTTGTGAGHKAAHERRRHTRTFTADRYTTMKGKTIVIPATWVGEHTKDVGNKRYEVMLGL